MHPHCECICPIELAPALLSKPHTWTCVIRGRSLCRNMIRAGHSPRLVQHLDSMHQRCCQTCGPQLGHWRERGVRQMYSSLSLGAAGPGGVAVLSEDRERVLCRGWRDEGDGDGTFRPIRTQKSPPCRRRRKSSAPPLTLRSSRHRAIRKSLPRSRARLHTFQRLPATKKEPAPMPRAKLPACSSVSPAPMPAFAARPKPRSCPRWFTISTSFATTLRPTP